MDIKEILLEQGFSLYIYEPTGFMAWSKEDLCALPDLKGWFILEQPKEKNV